MLLIQKISEDVKEAMKAHEAKKLDALRFILAALQTRQKEISGQGSDLLEDAEAVKVLQKEAKKRKEAMSLYEAGNRADLSEKEKFELDIIQAYLPKELNREEIVALIDGCMKEGAKDFPVLMKAVMVRTGGQADGKTVAELIKQKLQ